MIFALAFDWLSVWASGFFDLSSVGENDVSTRLIKEVMLS
jgi:hypothetical protein